MNGASSFSKGGLQPVGIGVKLQPPLLAISAYSDKSYENVLRVFKYPLLDHIKNSSSVDDVYQKLQKEDPAMFAPKFIDAAQVKAKISVLYDKVKQHHDEAATANEKLMELMRQKAKKEETGVGSEEEGEEGGSSGDYGTESEGEGSDISEVVVAGGETPVSPRGEESDEDNW